MSYSKFNPKNYNKKRHILMNIKYGIMFLITTAIFAALIFLMWLWKTPPVNAKIWATCSLTCTYLLILTIQILFCYKDNKEIKYEINKYIQEQQTKKEFETNPPVPHGSLANQYQNPIFHKVTYTSKPLTDTSVSKWVDVYKNNQKQPTVVITIWKNK